MTDSPWSTLWPTFLVIGAYKAGTTAVHERLRAHPEVFVPARKEPNFFAFVDAANTASTANPAYARSVHDEDAYTGLFAAARGASARGEVSPEYLLNPAAPAAIARRIPAVQLLAVLRNPVDRAWSDWLMYQREGRERADFATAIADQEARRRAGDPTGFYLATGEYAAQIARYLEVFPREQLHVWLYDELDRDPDGVLREMFTTIGVDPAVSPAAGERVNVGGVPRSSLDRFALGARDRVRPALRRLPLGGLRQRVSRGLDGRLVRPELDREMRAELTERFRPDIVRLQTLVGRDLSAWMEPS